MREKTTVGILIGKTPLANDDMALEFFTKDFGRITVFARKFANSQKRAREVDYFRLIELEVFEKKESFTLRKAKTLRSANSFGMSYEMMEIGGEWMKLIRTMYFEEEQSVFFDFCTQILFECKKDEIELWDVCFRVKRLQEMGIWPHLDVLRTDVYFDDNGQIFERKATGRGILKNESRQVLEFMRRMSFEVICEKIQNLPKDDISNMMRFIRGVEQIY